MSKLFPWLDHTRHHAEMWEDMFPPFGQLSDFAWMRHEQYETEDEWVFVIEIPGLSPDHQLDIRAINGELCITGRSKEKSEADLNQGYCESNMSFRYVTPLPKGLQSERMETELNGCVLRVRIPKP